MKRTIWDTNFSNDTHRNLWSIESKGFIRSTNTTQDCGLCSFRICNRERREKEPSEQPIFGNAPNCKGVPHFLKLLGSLYWLWLTVVLKLHQVNVYLSNNLDLKSFFFKKRILRFPIFQSSISTSLSKKSEHIWHKMSPFSIF